MLLAFKLSSLVTVPFGWLLNLLYELTSSYGMALILFAVLVKLILLPLSAKGRKSMMKMSRVTPQVQAIQQKYADDNAKQQQAVMELYKKEGVSMFGGCLWSFIPLLVLIPLYAVIRQPIQFMLGETAEHAALIVKTISEAAPELVGKNSFYAEMAVAHHIPEFVKEITAVLPEVSEHTLRGVDFTFLGLDLSAVPQFNIFKWSAYDWKHIGLFLIPVLSAVSQVLTMFINEKMNNSVVTNEKGLQDTETAKKSQQNQTNKVMMWMMPLMSLWIGFTICAALSLYWLVQGIASMITDSYLTKRYRKIYDAEDAERLKKAMAEEAAEVERERVRAERRAANPDGITANTSKKKIQKKQQQEEEAARAAAAREYAAKKGIAVEEETPAEKKALSGIPDRPYCKGRAYSPNRYGSHATED